MKLRTLFPIIFVVASCTQEKKTPDDKTPAKERSGSALALTAEQAKATGIVLGTTEKRTIKGGVRVNGQLDVPPQNMVSISAMLGGFIKNTELLQGMKIRKGQNLAVLEGPEYIRLQQEYLIYKSQVELAKSEYDRQQDLAKENVNAVKTLEQAKAGYFSARAKAEGAEATLRLIQINPNVLSEGKIQNEIIVTSPIAGFVTQVNVNIGMHVNPNDVMFRIVDTEHLHAEAQVFEKDIPKLKIGQSVRVVLSNDGRERMARVYLIGREITPDRTVRVHCHFEDEDPSLIPGLYFTGVIETGSQKVNALPDEAVVTFAGKKYVFISSDGLNFEMTEIKTGESDSGFTEIASPIGTSENVKIVIHGAFDLLSRLKNSEL